MTHMMRWSRPDINIATHYSTRHITLAGKTHYNAMISIMNYCVTTPERRLVLKSYGDWDEISTNYKFQVMVKMDSNYAKCPDTRRIMTGSVVYLNGVPVTFRSSTQKMVSLLTTEEELNVAVMCVQDDCS